MLEWTWQGWIGWWLVMVAAVGCGSSSNSPANDSGGSAAMSSTATTSGTATGGSTSQGSSITSTSTHGTTAAGGSPAVDPSQLFDPVTFYDMDADEPRTSGDRVNPLPRPVCPEQEPNTGDSCAPEAAECSYGESLQWACRRLYACEVGVWTRRNADCAETPPGYCPAEPSFGEACAAPVGGGSACTYGSTLCLCPHCAFFSFCPAGNVWTCIGPPADLDCPELVPNVGEGCGEQAQRCAYAAPCGGGGTIMFCRRGAWEAEGSECLE